jgi:hypothetical protein
LVHKNMQAAAIEGMSRVPSSGFGTLALRHEETGYADLEPVDFCPIISSRAGPDIDYESKG